MQTRSSRARFALAAVALSIGTFAPSAHAILAPEPLMDQWGTGARTTTLTCAGFSPTCSTGTSPIGVGPEQDNFQGLSATSSISDTRGSATVNAVIDNRSGINLPHLAGEAAAGQIAGGSAWALDGYTYSGPQTTRTLHVELTGSITNPIGSAFTDIEAGIYILSPYDIEGLLESSTDFFGYFGEGIFPIQELHLVIDQAGQTFDGGDIELTLEDGDQFYIWTYLSVGAGGGGTAQAMNSLDLAFDSPIGLTAASATAPVPEPATWGMLAAGLGLIGLGRRATLRRR